MRCECGVEVSRSVQVGGVWVGCDDELRVGSVHVCMWHYVHHGVTVSV